MSQPSVARPAGRWKMESIDDAEIIFHLTNNQSQARLSAAEFDCRTRLSPELQLRVNEMRSFLADQYRRFCAQFAKE